MHRISATTTEHPSPVATPMTRKFLIIRRLTAGHALPSGLVPGREDSTFSNSYLNGGEAQVARVSPARHLHYRVMDFRRVRRRDDGIDQARERPHAARAHRSWQYQYHRRRVPRQRGQGHRHGRRHGGGQRHGRAFPGTGHRWLPGRRPDPVAGLRRPAVDRTGADCRCHRDVGRRVHRRRLRPARGVALQLCRDAGRWPDCGGDAQAEAPHLQHLLRRAHAVAGRAESTSTVHDVPFGDVIIKFDFGHRSRRKSARTCGARKGRSASAATPARRWSATCRPRPSGSASCKRGASCIATRAVGLPDLPGLRQSARRQRRPDLRRRRVCEPERQVDAGSAALAGRLRCRDGGPGPHLPPARGEHDLA